MLLVQLTSAKSVRLFYKRGPNAQWVTDSAYATPFEHALEATHEIFERTGLDTDDFAVVDSRDVKPHAA